MANQNKLKAYVRYDGTGRVIAGGPILQRFKPKVGNWVEIDANECCQQTTTTTTTTAVYTIGQAALGGIIAYINGGGSTGTSGFVVTVEDVLTNTPPNASWGCDGTLITGADGTAIGTGNQNTIDIMAGCSDVGIAARLCGDLTEGGYSDWYLPSKDELNTLYINRVAIGMPSANVYWSSTENDSNTAWSQFFGAGIQGATSKGVSSRIRAIRSF